jgi:cell division protein ZapA
VDRVISIKLFGEPYTFRADAEAIHVEKIANYVVEQVEKARACAEGPAKVDTLILAALNIANDYFEMKQGREELVKDIDRRCKALIENIDANP